MNLVGLVIVGFSHIPIYPISNARVEAYGEPPPPPHKRELYAQVRNSTGPQYHSPTSKNNFWSTLTMVVVEEYKNIGVSQGLILKYQRGCHRLLGCFL